MSAILNRTGFEKATHSSFKFLQTIAAAPLTGLEQFCRAKIRRTERLCNFSPDIYMVAASFFFKWRRISFSKYFLSNGYKLQNNKNGSLVFNVQSSMMIIIRVKTITTTTTTNEEQEKNTERKQNRRNTTESFVLKYMSH